MSCRLVKKSDGVTAFQCTPNEFQTFGVVDGQNKIPYDEGECQHRNRFELKGLLRCKDCASVYDEATLTWVPFTEE